MSTMFEGAWHSIASLAQWAEESRMVGRELWEELHRARAADGLSVSALAETGTVPNRRLGAGSRLRWSASGALEWTWGSRGVHRALRGEHPEVRTRVGFRARSRSRWSNAVRCPI